MKYKQLDIYDTIPDKYAALPWMTDALHKIKYIRIIWIQLRGSMWHEA